MSNPARDCTGGEVEGPAFLPASMRRHAGAAVLLAASIAMSGCGGGGSGSGGSSASSMNAAGVTAPRAALKAPQSQLTLACLDAATLASIRADFTQIKAAKARCLGELNQDLPGLATAGDQMDAAFATVVAYLTADAAVGDASGVLTKDEWFALQAQTLFRVLQPSLADTEFHLLSVYGGTVGQRAQVDYSGAAGALILDPWAGVVAAEALDDLLTGEIVAAGESVAFVRSDAAPAQITAQLAMLSALSQGTYRPSDLLYFQPSPAFYQAFQTGGYSALSGQGETIAAAYMSPGGYQLATDGSNLPGVSDAESSRLSTAQVSNWVSWSALKPANHIFQCLPASQVTAIRANTALAVAARQACDAELRTVFAALSPTSTQLDAIFSTLLSHAMAPYGSDSSLLFPALLAQPTLECEGYSVLASYFLDIVSQGASPGKLRMLGWLHPVFGNHAQLLYEEAGRALLLDPTIGMAASVGSNDSLMSGVAVPPTQIVTFYLYDPQLVSFLELVYNSVMDGAYRPSDQIYYSPNPQFLIGTWASAPTAADLTMDKYLTPGGYRLAVQQGLTL